MDSVDLPKTHGPDRGRKSTAWSYKLNRPGRRFMFVQDLRRRVRKVFGGYSPKVYDGDFLEIQVRAIGFKGCCSKQMPDEDTENPMRHVV